jgi:hypothetical protein
MTAAEMHTRYPALPGFAKENKSLVFAMIDAGWTGRITSKGHYLAKAPDRKTQITVPAKNGNNRGLANAHAQFMRWVRDHLNPEIQSLWDTAIETDDPMLRDVLAESIVRKQTEQIVTDNIMREAAEFMAAISKPKPAPAVTLTPWLAKKQPGKQGGRTYESEAVLERTWPDGRVDWLCAKPDCGYESDNPRGVAAHYGKAHTLKGQTPPASQDGPVHVDPAYTEPTTTRDYKPTQRLVDALASFLAEHSWDNVDDLAVLMLEWAHYRDDIEHETRPLVPLTDKDILNKIRMLVGQPDQTSEIEALRSEITVLESEVHRLREERTALRELLS